jgi:hypothetical protein
MKKNEKYVARRRVNKWRCTGDTKCRELVTISNGG